MSCYCLLSSIIKNRFGFCGATDGGWDGMRGLGGRGDEEKKRRGIERMKKRTGRQEENRVMKILPAPRFRLLVNRI